MLLMLLMILLFPAFALATTVTTTIATDAAAGTWTTAILPSLKSQSGFLNVSIYGATWEGTVRLQRSFDGGTTYYDVATWTANSQDALIDKETGVRYRIGMANGDFTSGSVAVSLSDEGG